MGPAAKKFPVTVRIDSSWTEEAADFCFTLRLLGGECTDPVVDHEELSFMMTIQSSGAKMSPVGDGRAARIRTKCRQIDVQFV